MSILVSPIAETFSYPAESTRPEAVAARDQHICAQLGTVCAKWEKTGLGYCSVLHTERGGVEKKYMTCEHRIGVDVAREIAGLHFGTMAGVYVKPQVGLDGSKVDYAACRIVGGQIVERILIETQTADIKGSVRDAYEAVIAGQPIPKTEHGINFGNVYKRQGGQVTNKGRRARAMDNTMVYLVMQAELMNYFLEEAPFDPLEAGETPEIGFVFLEYSDAPDPATGRYAVVPTRIIQTTFAKYVMSPLKSLPNGALLTEGFDAAMKNEWAKGEPADSRDAWFPTA